MKRKHCYLEKRKRGKDKQYEHYKKNGKYSSKHKREKERLMDAKSPKKH